MLSVRFLYVMIALMSECLCARAHARERAVVERSEKRRCPDEGVEVILVLETEPLEHREVDEIRSALDDNARQRADGDEVQDRTRQLQRDLFFESS